MSAAKAAGTGDATDLHTRYPCFGIAIYYGGDSYSEKAEISNKGKHRTVFLPHKLRQILKKYATVQNWCKNAICVVHNGTMDIEMM